MMQFKSMMATVGAIALNSAVIPAAHAVTVLTFEGVGNNNAVANFYNGGAGGNFGISFVNAFGLVDFEAGGSGGFANEPSPSTALWFPSSNSGIMNVSSGFDTAFSFFYSAGAVSSVNVYTGVNGSGSLLASTSLPAQRSLNCSGDPSGNYCNWTPIGLSFSGIAKSVVFSSPIAGFQVFDNVTLGSAAPSSSAVPEPATWAMMIVGFGAIGGAMRRRRKVKASLSFA